jgi:hydrophobe/amphiphile efflux-1 (HAE1) family protein
MAKQPAQLNDLPGLSVRRPYLAVVLNLLIIIAGISAVLGVEVRELPDVDRPIVSVRGNLPNGSPETIDAEVTKIIEGAVARVNGVKRVRSSSEENNFRIHIEFQPSVDLIDAAADVREAVSRVRRDLPDGVENIFVVKADADARSIIKLAVFGDNLTIEQITRRVENQIIPELTSVDGVANVRLFGDRKRVLRVVVEPLKLASYRLSITDLAKVLKNARYDVPAGSFQSQHQEVMVRANASVTDPKKIERLIIRDQVRVGDVANVFFGPADAENYVRLNGRTVLRLGIIRQARSNTIAISAGVERAIDRLNTRFGDLKIKTISDDSRFIEGAIREVLISLILAIGIVITVIAIFIGQWRAALIPALTIPIALTGTVAAVWLLGFSINLVTLLALVLAAGLVVDDAIVVLENIQRNRAEGLAPRAAAVIGTRQVFFAVVATTVTLVSVFIPISFLPSAAGRLFTEFGFVLAMAVTISSFVALTLCPMMASRLPETGDRKKQGMLRPSLNVVGDGLRAAGHGAKRLYSWLLDRVLAAPLVVVGLCPLVAVSGFLVFQSLDEELVPKEDRGVVTVLLTGPDGTGLDYADAQVERIENMFRPWIDKGVVTDLFTITGRFDPNRGWIDAPLADWSKRSVSQEQVTAKLRRPVSRLPGARARILRANSLGLRNAQGGIKFALTGNDYGRLFAAAQAFVLAMEQEIPQIGNVRIEFRATQPELSVGINRRRAADLGVEIENLAATLQALVDNQEVAEFTVDDQVVPVILQASDGAIDNPSDLRNLYVRGTGGKMVALSQLVTFKESAVAAELDRHGQRRAIEIDGDPVDGYALRKAVDAVRNLADKQLTGGLGLVFLGQAAELDETSRGVLWTFLVAFLVVFLVLVAQFESVTSALVVLLTVPFGICAAIFALALTGTSINIYSQIGVLMLIGIMAKNSILVVEFADQLRERGEPVIDAVRQASNVRLRPIVMTMCSTILAGLPLILGSGPGAESRAAIGWVVFGGLGLAAVFTLFLTPAIYVLVARFAKPRHAAGDALQDELAKAAGSSGPAE